MTFIQKTTVINLDRDRRTRAKFGNPTPKKVAAMDTLRSDISELETALVARMSKGVNQSTHENDHDVTDDNTESSGRHEVAPGSAGSVVAGSKRKSQK